jgi:hypothetical protein
MARWLKRGLDAKAMVEEDARVRSTVEDRLYEYSVANVEWSSAVPPVLRGDRSRGAAPTDP